MPGDSGVLVVTRVRSATTKGTRDRGCNGHPAFPTPSFGREINAQLGRIAPRDCEVAFVIGAGTRNACPGCCATPTPSARSRASSTRYVLRRGALLIRVHCALRIALGPGSAVHREERCTASGKRDGLLHTSQDEVLDPHGEEHDNAARLEPCGHGWAGLTGMRSISPLRAPAPPHRGSRKYWP